MRRLSRLSDAVERWGERHPFLYGAMWAAVTFGIFLAVAGDIAWWVLAFALAGYVAWQIREVR